MQRSSAPSGIISRIVLFVALLVAVLYPLLVYFGLNTLEPRHLALLLVEVLLLRLLWGKGKVLMPAADARSSGSMGNPQVLVTGILLLLMFLYTLSTNNADALRLYPVIINFSLLLGFAHSLRHPPSAIERLARLTQADLPPRAIVYTRKVTIIWCGFFFCNGCIALYTSLFASLQTWTLYNGLVAYLLTGALLGGEYLFRQLVVKPSFNAEAG